MAPFLPRSDQANDAGYSPSQSNRGRDVGIIIACLAGIILTIFLLGRYCGGYNACRGRKRHRAGGEQHHEHDEQRRQQQHIDPARFMQFCAQQDARTKKKERIVLTAVEVDLMAPLTATSHPPTTSPASPVVVSPASASPEGSRISSDTARKAITTTTHEASGNVDPEPIVRPHCTYRPQSEEEEAVTCCVCLEGFGDGELVRATRCSHTFHGHCLERWLMRYHSRCPLCQANLKPDGKESI